jgi:hypothetical protein
MTEQADIIPASQVTTDHEVLCDGTWHPVTKATPTDPVSKVKTLVLEGPISEWHSKSDGLLAVRPKQQKPDTLFDRLWELHKAHDSEPANYLESNEEMWTRHVTDQLDVIATYMAEHQPELVELLCNQAADVGLVEVYVNEQFGEFVEALLGPRS